MGNRQEPGLAHAVLLRLPVFWIFWGSLSEGEALWSWGLPTAVLATAVSLAAVPPMLTPFRTTLHTLSLVPRLFLEALVSGWDVARRAFLPSRPLDPDIIDVRIGCGEQAVAIAIGYAATVMPGTLALEVDRCSVRIHVIDRTQPNRQLIGSLERRLENVFGFSSDKGEEGRLE